MSLDDKYELWFKSIDNLKAAHLKDLCIGFHIFMEKENAGYDIDDAEWKTNHS